MCIALHFTTHHDNGVGTGGTWCDTLLYWWEGREFPCLGDGSRSILADDDNVQQQAVLRIGSIDPCLPTYIIKRGTHCGCRVGYYRGTSNDIDYRVSCMARLACVVL